LWAVTRASSLFRVSGNTQILERGQAVPEWIASWSVYHIAIYFTFSCTTTEEDLYELWANNYLQLQEDSIHLWSSQLWHVSKIKKLWHWSAGMDLGRQLQLGLKIFTYIVTLQTNYIWSHLTWKLSMYLGRNAFQSRWPNLPRSHNAWFLALSQYSWPHGFQ